MINFKSVYSDLDEHIKRHYQNLILYDSQVSFDNRTPPRGYENFRCVDIFGPVLEEINDQFSDCEWYLWFESVFLVPRDMYLMLVMKYSGEFF